MAEAKLEFDVQLSCESCCNAVKSALEGVDGVRNVTVNLREQSVVVETSAPSSLIHERIESTNRKAVLKGLGSATGAHHLGAAVSALTGPNSVMGVVRFLQIDEKTCVIDGTIDGLMPGEHGMHVYEYGDLSGGCSSLGSHYNPTNSCHGGPTDLNRHAGDLGNILVDGQGRTSFRIVNDFVKVWNLIGRSLGVTSSRDDLGRGGNEGSKIDGNSGQNVCCGIIARSAGLFENPKRLCACSGQTIWEERNQALLTHSNAKI